MKGILQYGNCPVRVYADLHQLSAAVAQHCVQYIQSTLAQQDECHIALAGGSTPESLYTLLATTDYMQQISWDKVHIYFGDERYVSHDSPQSNFCMARTALLDKVPLLQGNIHPIPTDAGDAESDAQAYAQLLTRNLPYDNNVPVFDLILLGMGEDGHTASLFPGTPILTEKQKPVAAVYVDTLASWRISLTYPVLNAARCLLFLVSGKNKAAQIRAIFTSEHSAHVPIQQIQPAHACYWYLDADAAAELET